MTTRDKFSQIKDEVKDFHPLLQRLLLKLPDIVDIEYTHGPNEMGADFVLAKRNNIWKNIEYVGVIAKTGKITQNYTDIERQIDECLSLSRTFLNGRESIYISEVWIVITESVSNNAQSKIHAKYKSSKIIFVDGERIQKLIDDHLPMYWSEIPLEIGSYLTSLRLANEKLDNDLNLIEISNKSFYIEQDIYEFPRLAYRLRMQRKNKQSPKVSILSTINNKEIVLIEGGMGAGKSKLLRYLIEHFTSPDIFSDQKVIPVFVSYKELTEKFNEDFLLLIESRVGKRALQELNDVTVLVLIDGFDEKNIAPEEQIEALEILVQNIKKTPNIKAIITSRYLRELDKTPILERDVFRCQIAPLSLKRTIEFINAICTELSLATRFIEDLKKSSLFKELPRSPIAAIILAKLLNENPQDLPSSMTELYSQYIELMLGRWDIRKGLQSQKEYKALDSIMAEYARNVLDYEMDRFTIPDAYSVVKSYLEDRNLDINAEDLFEKMTERCEVIWVDKHNNTIGFKHRTFAEFFYAKHLLRNGNPSLAENAFRLYWSNTTFFYLGLQKDCSEILHQLISVAPADEMARWLKVAQMAHYMLAAYASPYKTIEDGLCQAMIEAAQLFQDIVSGTINSPFTSMSRMHVLYLIQLVVRQSYSYVFFERAIDEAALRISASSLDEDTKIYASFFLGVVAVELKRSGPFDFLLRDNPKNLPLDISMALGHEKANLEDRSDLMKRHEKTLKHQIKGNRSLSLQIKKIYENPINLPADKTKPA